MIEIILQLHGGKGSSTTNVQSYKPTDQEVRLQKQAADYSEAVAPNALWLNNTARNVLQDSLGTVQVDYNSLNNNAQQQIANAQQGVAGLTTGQLPTAYQQNMENSIRSGVENTLGSAVNGLASRGVLSSSVANKAINDISKNASDTMAQQYSNNISTLNGLYGQQSQLAGQGISTAAASQEAAQAPSLALWNASLGLNGAGTSALGAVSGQGTTTSTSTQSGGSGGLFTGLASSALSAFCFVANTLIAMADGTDKKIKHVTVGDKVKSYDFETGKYYDVEVIEVAEPVVSDTYQVVTTDNNYVFTTLTQPLLDINGNWVLVSNLTIGKELAVIGKIKSVVFSGEREVYDLKVSGNNIYIANGFIARGKE